MRSVGTGDIARGRIIRIETGRCYEVRVRVWDVFGFPKEDIRYVHSHTWTPNWEFTIPGSPSWSFRRVEIGFTALNEKSGCPSTGPHLHQELEGVFWSANRSNFLSPGTTYDVEAQANWQYQQSWTWN
jgi:hypothetical protein